MEKQRCSKCKEKKSLDDFSGKRVKNRICKECAAKYYKEYKGKQIEKHGKQRYYEILWEKRIRRKAERSGIPQNSFDINKVNNLSWKLQDYPDRSFPDSMTHVNFMKEYNLSVNEYIYIRQKVRGGNYWVK